ncbi:MAG: transposase [Candidatus Omnitrophota bacterium]|jgi:REP element-mobilizing transposase RayT
MPYRNHKFAKDNYYHVFLRGNERRTIFQEIGDYERFLRKLKEYKSKHEISVICYCLMPNHFHLLLKQNTEESVSAFMHRLMISYVMYFNARYERRGFLFEGRFKSKLITNDAYLLQLSRYIHLNPLNNLKSIPLEQYYWSSYGEYLDLTHGQEQICDKEVILDQFGGQFNKSQRYKEFVNSTISLKENEIIKRIEVDI